MESLVFFQARLLAVAYSLALAFEHKDGPVVAELTRSNFGCAFVLVMIGKLWAAYLDYYDLLVDVDVCKSDACADVGLKAVTWELHSRVLFYCSVGVCT